jgi:serine/threonine protein kinase
MLTGEYPLATNDEKMIDEHILRGEYVFHDFLSPSCLALVKAMLVNDPKKRLTLFEIVNSEWVLLNGGIDLNEDSSLQEQVVASLSKLDVNNNNHVFKFLEPIFVKMQECGLSKELIIKCLHKETLNHVRATFLLYLDDIFLGSLK